MSQVPIDQTALQNLKSMIGGDADDLAELIDDFMSTLPVQVDHMKAHSAKGDWRALRITSHSCKSNSRDMGALQLGDLCAALELQCKEGQPTGLDEQIDHISEEAKTVLEAISKLDPKDV